MMKSRLKKNNEGFTLVEVIVSLMILSIVVLSILELFVVVAKANLKARKRQYATTVASNILEKVKATADLSADAGSPRQWLRGVKTKNTLTGAITYTYATDADVAADIASGYYYPKAKTYAAGTGTYTYYDENIKNYAEGTMKFNAIVTYDPTVYNTATLSSSSGAISGINLYQYPDIVTFKTDSAAVLPCDFTGASGYDAMAASEFQTYDDSAKSSSGGTVVDTADILAGMSRTVTITISDDAKDSGKVDYNFSIDYKLGSVAGYSSSAATEINYDSSEFPTIKAGKDVTGVYIFYSPVSITSSDELCIVDNTTNGYSGTYANYFIVANKSYGRQADATMGVTKCTLKCGIKVGGTSMSVSDYINYKSFYCSCVLDLENNTTATETFIKEIDESGKYTNDISGVSYGYDCYGRLIPDSSITTDRIFTVTVYVFTDDVNIDNVSIVSGKPVLSTGGDVTSIVKFSSTVVE